MRISDNDIKQIRNMIAEKLNAMPDGCQIPIDKELLERLLFEERIAKSSGIKAKFPVWSGEFLTKISNLNEISFDGLVLDPLNPEYASVDFFDKDICDILSYYQHGKDCIIKYGNTGIAIDIPASFTVANYRFQESNNPNAPKPILTSVDLSNTSLMDGNKPCIITNYFSEIFDSSLSYAKVSIALSSGASIKFCSLKGLDLSAYNLNYKILSKSGLNGINLYKTDLSDTFLAIDAHNIEDKESGESLGTAIKDGHLNHCTVNGVKIHTKDELATIAFQQKRLYELYKKNILETIDKDIISAEAMARI